MNYSTILTLVVTASYLIHVGLIKSISDSYRTIRDIRIYHLFFFISGVLIACQGIYSRDELDIPYAVAGFLFFGISLAAKFWGERHEGNLHIGFTLSAICLGLAMTIIRIWPDYGFWSISLVAVAAVGSLLIKRFMSNSTYWVEVLVYLIVFLPILKA